MNNIIKHRVEQSAAEIAKNEPLNNETLFSKIDQCKSELESKIIEMQNAIERFNRLQLSPGTFNMFNEDEKQ